MNPRKCIYTNGPANTRDAVIPKRHGDALHNWANRVPVDSEYLKNKQDRLPTELEMEANRLFYLLELAKLDVTYLEERLKQVQEEITGVKQDRAEKESHVKELTENFEENVEKVLKKKSDKLWE